MQQNAAYLSRLAVTMLAFSVQLSVHVEFAFHLKSKLAPSSCTRLIDVGAANDAAQRQHSQFRWFPEFSSAAGQV
jgi:hypothetical protein